MEKEYLTAAARAVDVQASETPNFGIPVDPEVAEFMGAFQEQAVSLDDLDAMLFDEGADDHGR